MSVNFTNATAIPMETPSQTATLVANIVQAVVFVALGPFVTVYGPSLIHLVTLIRSLFAMNYLAFINSVSGAPRVAGPTLPRWCPLSSPL